MKCFFSLTKIGVLVGSFSGAVNTSMVAAAEPYPCEQVFAPAPSNCNCHQWTCPACQSSGNCQSTPAQPGMPSPPAMGQMPDGQQSLIQPQPGSNGDPIPQGAANPPSASAAAAAAAEGLDLSGIAGNNNRNSRSDSAGSQSRFSNAIEMQGDNFGPIGGQSVVAQVFSYNVDPAFVGGGFYIFDIPGPSTSSPDLTGQADTTNPLLVTLDQPSPGSDAGAPAGNEFTYQGGTVLIDNPSSPTTGRATYAYVSPVSIPTSVTGRMKLAENVSPIPRDRVFFNYSSFNNVPLTNRGITVNRFTPGFEKTFFGKLASVEVRAPFASTLDSNIFTDGSTNTSKSEFGNLFFAFKGIALATNKWAISGGTSFTVPTADDNRVFTRNGTELVRVVNESVHVMPFIGGVYTPSSRFFTQGILQVDIDVNGNTVLGQRGNLDGSLSKIGTFQDSTFLYADLGMGYWILKRGSRDNSIIRGIIPTVEAHWNRSLNDADCVQDSITVQGVSVPTTVIQPVISQLDVLNMVSGVAIQFRNNSRVSFGYAAPVGNSKDRVFDGELRATWNKFY